VRKFVPNLFTVPGGEAIVQNKGFSFPGLIARFDLFLDRTVERAAA
jgi:hypothetical protein